MKPPLFAAGLLCSLVVLYTRARTLRMLALALVALAVVGLARAWRTA